VLNVNTFPALLLIHKNAYAIDKNDYLR